MNIYIIDTDPKITSDLTQKVKRLKIGTCKTAAAELTVDEIASLNPNMAILGPSLDTNTCLKCIHKLKIIDSFMPVLTSCTDLFSPEGKHITPFNGIYSISRSLEPDEITTTVKTAFENKEELETGSGYSMLIGQTPEMIDIRQKVLTLSNKDVTLLITGETGTGKELIARSIHFHSQRKKQPLVKINCVALPDELLESEVFGFQKGAFTGAHKNKPGLLEMADGGTLFIDEIGALSLPPQAKFLQVLEDKAFSRLGGIRDKKLDIRIVAATNADLRKLVQAGTFRKDLYYRLNIMNIHVPPLRERKGDIPLLIHYLLNKYCFELRKKIIRVPDNVTSFLLSYHWPGNVRELENVVRRAIVLRNWEFIFHELSTTTPDTEGEHPISASADSMFLNWTDAQMKKLFEDNNFSLKKISKAYVSEAERLMILRTLRETEWNRKKAAQKLQVSYKTLLNRIEEFRLKP